MLAPLREQVERQRLGHDPVEKIAARLFRFELRAAFEKAGEAVAESDEAAGTAGQLVRRPRRGWSRHGRGRRRNAAAGRDRNGGRREPRRPRRHGSTASPWSRATSSPSISARTVWARAGSPLTQPVRRKPPSQPTSPGERSIFCAGAPGASSGAPTIPPLLARRTSTRLAVCKAGGASVKTKSVTSVALPLAGQFGVENGPRG